MAKTKQEMADDAAYELLVDAFIEGFIDEEPDADEYGVSQERQIEIIGRKVVA
jgi:hypothetical protein